MTERAGSGTTDDAVLSANTGTEAVNAGERGDDTSAAIMLAGIAVRCAECGRLFMTNKSRSAHRKAGGCIDPGDEIGDDLLPRFHEMSGIWLADGDDHGVHRAVARLLSRTVKTP